MDLTKLLGNVDQGISAIDWSLDAYKAFLIKPQEDAGIGGFLFGIPKSTEISLSADITDYFVENNTSRQDNIALKPIEIETGGFIGELNLNDPYDTRANDITRISDRLALCAPVLPELTVAQRQVYETVKRAYSEYKKAAGLVGNDLPGPKNEKVQTSPYAQFIAENEKEGLSAQELAFAFFQYCRDNRILFTIQTPWRLYNNMFARVIRAKQGDKDTMITEFSITFKQMQFVNTRILKGTMGRQFVQGQTIQDKGTSRPVRSNLKTLWQWGKGS